MNIYFFGDSISFGQDMSVERTWVNRIGEHLRKNYQGGVMVQNLSINGNTTRMALERMPYDIQSHEVDILVVGFGMNDCNYWETDRGLPRVSPQAFKANMNEIVQRAYANGVKRVVLHTNHTSPRGKQMCGQAFSYKESNAKYNDIIREVAEENRESLFTDIEKKIGEYLEENHKRDEDIVLEDRVHLSALGHELYFRIMLPVVEKAIQEAERAV